MARGDEDFEVPIFPLLEIFGGAYGVLLIVLVVMILAQQRVANDMNDPARIGGVAELTMSDQAGTVISLYATHLKIETTDEIVELQELKRSTNRFESFARASFLTDSTRIPLLFVYPGSNDVFLAVEHAFAALDIRNFNQLVVNKEMVERLKATLKEDRATS